MGSTARPLHDPGNHRSHERRSVRQAARRGRMTQPARPAGDLERPRALTPPPGARSEVACLGAGFLPQIEEPPIPSAAVDRVVATCAVMRAMPERLEHEVVELRPL